MNLTLFYKLMRDGELTQHSREWRIFLELCSLYLKKHRATIKDLIVVELGVKGNAQKKFWEQLFGAEHIGINISDKLGTPDILGESDDPKTLKMLKSKLKNRMISILFIDGDHHYESVKGNFEMYSPLCSDIIAFPGIETFRYKKRMVAQVWKFWDELKLGRVSGAEQYKDYLSLSIHKRRLRGCQKGIGMIMKK